MIQMDTINRGENVSNPWIKQLPTKIRDRHATNQTEYDQLLLEQREGDWITVHEGNYNAGGIPHLSNANTVILAEGHAKTGTEFHLDLPDAYIMGLHMGGKQRMSADRTGFINFVIEGDGQLGYAGLLSTGGKEQLTYGGIIRNCQHGWYGQNKSTDGTEQVVHNYIGDCVSSGNSRSIHAYTQQPDNLYRMQFIQNVINGNQALLGGEVNATAPLYNLFQDNWFHLADLLLGYKRPECTDLISNRFLNSILLREHFFGDDVSSDDWSIVTNNDFYNDGEAHGWDHVRFRTHPDGMARIRSVEQWDNNRYYGPDFFRAPFKAGGIDTYIRGLIDWNENTFQAGKEFDTNSTFTIGLPPDQYWLIPNDYDADRAMLVVWNGSRTIVDVNLPRMGTFASVDDPYTESLPTQIIYVANSDLSYHLIRYTDPPPTCNLPEARRLLNEAYAKSNQKGVRTRIKEALKNMEGC